MNIDINDINDTITIKVLEGLEDVKKGNTIPADQFFSEFRLKHKIKIPNRVIAASEPQSSIKL